ncbi:MAG: DUF302 domain-containing protein [Desulfuromonadaceae bacterium]|nr:DUF302 domain-containing protein [Desulfuromonadaceae bacterium]
MSKWATLVCRETDKSVEEVIAALQTICSETGFIIHNEDKMEMANTFGSHGVEVAKDFDLHMVQICNPEKAAPSLQKNHERAALIPKFVTIFSQNGKTQVRLLRLEPALIEELIQDKDFAESSSKNYDAIIAQVDKALAV